AVGGEPLVVHAFEHGDSAVNVTVELDVELGVMGAKEAADVLNDSPLERQREREEQGVELRPVEPFSEVGPGGDEDDPVPGLAGSDRVSDSLAGLLADAALEHERA